jgi:hypothetical protein
MSSLANYYHIYTASPDPCSINESSLAEAEKTWLCRGGNGVKPSVTTVDVNIQENTPGKDPLNIVSGTGVAIARRDFLGEVGEAEVRNHFWLGRVLLPGRKEASDWTTYRGRKRLIIRGSKNVAHRYCPECGQFLYYAAGPRYLCPTPPSDVNIFESDLQGLVLTKEVFVRLALRKWTKLFIEKVPVPTQPRDGLPVLIGEI